ncbi:adenylate kinase [Paenibacillus sp. GCM10012303]|uniref:adenylate kinase n=1 Tax=Paenibacillus sp. GCM10012303 TaxID=3317340 RepID=UPI003610D8BD
MMKEAGIPYFSLDYLMMGIANGVPELGVQPTEGDFLTGQRLWKIVEPLMTAMVENGIDYTVEGVQLLPAFVAQFQHKFAGDVRCCFIGQAELDVTAVVEMKLHSSATENDGFKDLNPNEALAEMKRIQADSARYKEECEMNHLPYFESSSDFHRTLDQVVAYLINK